MPVYSQKINVKTMEEWIESLPFHSTVIKLTSGGGMLYCKETNEIFVFGDIETKKEGLVQSNPYENDLISVLDEEGL